jgi:hypothetical protein
MYPVVRARAVEWTFLRLKTNQKHGGGVAEVTYGQVARRGAGERDEPELNAAASRGKSGYGARA